MSEKRLRLMAWVSRRLKRTARTARKFTVRISMGWWLEGDLTDATGHRYALSLLVEPDEIGPVLKALERNGTEQGRSFTVRWGVGQTGRQQLEAKREADIAAEREGR